VAILDSGFWIFACPCHMPGWGFRISAFGFRISLAVFVSLILALPGLSASQLWSAEAEADAAAAAQAQARAAQTGLVRGSMNPGKRGLVLPSSPRVMVIPINDENTKYGMIDEWQALFVERRLARAQEGGYDLVILEIDTNGGSVQACERINRAIAACKVPVLAYVKLKAFSGGALVSLGCRAIVMTPGSRIGGAKAVTLFGDLPEDMREKIDSDMRAMVTNLCEANGHPTAIAVGMVNSNVEVLETDDVNNRFMTGAAYEELRVKPAVVHKWKSKGQILTLTASEALNVGLALGEAADMDELFIGLGVTRASTEYAGITPTETVVRFLGHPLWRVLLVIIALVGLVWELKTPGHGVGFIVFAFCMGVFFWLQIFLDNAGLLEVALFGIGAALVAVEVFFLPTFGAMGFAGFAMVLVAVILAFLPKSVSLSTLFKGGPVWEVQVLNEGLKWAAVTVVAIVAAVATILLKGASLPGLSLLALRTEVQGTAHGSTQPTLRPVGRGQGEGDGTLDAAKEASQAHSLAALVGQAAEAETTLRPAGKIRLGGATYDAVSEGGYIEAGAQVVILRISSGNLVVRAS